jgi:hypothetical protein
MSEGPPERTKEEFLAEVRKKQTEIEGGGNHGDPRLAADIAVYADFHGAKYHYLYSRIRWLPEPKHNTRQVTVEVPVGFVTDFASVPRPFWALIPPSGLYTQAAIAHDYMYWFQGDLGWKRDDADEVFGHFMADLGVGSMTRATILGAIRVAGGVAWDNNAKAKKAGEKRVLKKFPSNPLTTWEEWKRNNENFL